MDKNLDQLPLPCPSSHLTPLNPKDRWSTLRGVGAGANRACIEKKEGWREGGLILPLRWRGGVVGDCLILIPKKKYPRGVTPPPYSSSDGLNRQAGQLSFE